MTIKEQEVPEKLIVIVGGPAGTGKSTVAAALTSQLTNYPTPPRNDESMVTFPVQFIEGDELHPAMNIAKMSAGIPLTDEDRMPWLKLLAETVVNLEPAPDSMPPIAAVETKNLSAETFSGEGAADTHKVLQRQTVVCTCSCLKRKYRDYLRAHITGVNVRLRFVFLYASPAELVARTMKRQGHFMKPDMIQSQIEAMEVPTGDELITGCSDGPTPGDTVAVGEDLQALGPQKLAQWLVNDSHIFP